jgi:octaprenyl-diphosphate synthase
MIAVGTASGPNPETTKVTMTDLQRIQEPVRDRLDAVWNEMRSAVENDAPLVGQMSAHVMAMRGKMFRPTLVLLSSSVTGNQQDSAVTHAAAVELIHLATLVHDDAIDHSILRRGMPTLNALFSHQISVIMGDFLYSIALTQLVALGNIQALRALTRASTEMTIGELRQLAVTVPLRFSESDYYELIRAKTASLISAACEIGALCGAVEHCATLAKYGEHLGMAFQIIDDLIDYTEAASTAGKPTGLDLKEHKVTLPLIAALRAMPETARRRVEALFAQDEPTDEAIADVVRIVADNGGLAYAREMAAGFAAEARKTLDDLPDTVARTALIDSISYVMERHA